MMNYNIQKGQFRLTTAHPRGSWWEFYRVPCPICNGIGNCMLHVSQEKVACTVWKVSGYTVKIQVIQVISII